ncbi:heme-binding protein [Nonomuraea longicatena]|uniref:Heme-binding protein n=1 Tax=Nonomuraea longicatena TaxID=83682 RepID=A0ABN1QTV3_9ACTN
MNKRTVIGSLAGLALVGGLAAAQAVPASAQAVSAQPPAQALAAASAVKAAPTSAATVASAAVEAAATAKNQAVVQQPVLSSDAAMKIADAALKEAAKQKQRVTVAIVDRSGATRLIVKGDGAGPQTEESARRKAFTSVSFGQPTSAIKNPALSAIPGTLLLAGGIPVASGGAPIAGIGVGGAPSGEIDEAIARAGLKAVEGQLG